MAAKPKTPQGSDFRSDDMVAADRAIDALTFAKSRTPFRAAGAPDIRRILVGVDGTGSSSMALGWAKEIALATGAKLFVATITGPIARGPFAQSAVRATLMQREEKIARDVLEKAVAGLDDAGLDVTGVLARGFATVELLRIADKKRVDLVVVGSHGHSGRERVLVGSVADSIKDQVSCSVLVAKTPFGSGPVLIPVDGSPDSRAAAVVGLRLSRRFKAEPQIYHVFEPPVFYDPEDARDEFKHILGEIELPSTPAGIRYLLDLGHPRKRILEYIAQNRPRLVVMGARGLSPIRKLLTGSTGSHVVHESSASVLLVRRRNG